MKKTVKKIRIFAWLALAPVSLVMLLTLADCGCKEKGETKGDAPARVEQRQGQSPYASTTVKSPSRTAMEKALGEGRPVFLNFHSNQCIPCIEMEKVIEEVEPEYEGRVAFVVVDVYDPAETSFCDYFRVRVIPTSFFIQSDGKVVDSYEGLVSSEQMRALLDKLISAEGKTSPSP